LGAALASMVCNLTVGKEKYKDVEKEVKKIIKQSEDLRKKLTKLIDEDTNAFNDVMKAFKMPKETEEQKKKRSEAIQEGYKSATKVPLKTAETCQEIFELAEFVAMKGNQNSITDAAVSALMAKAGVFSALLNVKINLSSIRDEEFVESISKKISDIEKYAKKEADKIMKIVEKNI
jgi:formiminotetrahydrofolate cyclodeaminase